jgi:hypothetical protein
MLFKRGQLNLGFRILGKLEGKPHYEILKNCQITFDYFYGLDLLRLPK